MNIFKKIILGLGLGFSNVLIITSVFAFFTWTIQPVLDNILQFIRLFLLASLLYIILLLVSQDFSSIFEVKNANTRTKN